ncbi:MAG: glycine cleavage system aminomethyltransferase GcvT, partial [Actinomycetota bacterium]
LGKAAVTGPGALEFLNTVFTNNLNRISDGQAQYTLICDDLTGGVIDDLIAYRYSQDRIFLIPNAANTSEVLKRLSQSAPGGVEVKNLHEEHSVIALQGPESDAVLRALGVSLQLEYMSFAECEIAEKKVVLCRTGYTGERGYEILTKWSDALIVWNVLLNEVTKVGGRVAGLGARDTLRTEMGYPLHGHELSMTISPVEASASWAVSWQKAFWGKAVMQAQRESKKHRVLQALRIEDRGIPRADMEVQDERGEVIGVVTSGTFSPTLKGGIALALLSHRYPLDTKLLIDIRGKHSVGTIVRLPFVPSHVK